MSQHPSSTFVVTDPIEIVGLWSASKTSASCAYVRRGPEVELMIEQVVEQIRCPACEGRAQVKERPLVAYVDLPVYGTPDVAGVEESTGCAVRTGAVPRGAWCSAITGSWRSTAC